MYRMGMLACLRSIYKDCQYIGCMVTASHNLEEDNGCKLVDPLGEMLEEKWETYATQLVNSNDLHEALINLCEQPELKQKIEIFNSKNKGEINGNNYWQPQILIAFDTRPSCAQLVAAFKAGVKALNGNLIDYGLLTTPQLHYMVRCRNTNNSYGEPTEHGYFDKLSKAFKNVWSMIDFEKNKNYQSEICIDGANGVGATKISLLDKSLGYGECLKIFLFNDAKTSDDRLNHLCGADFVKVQQKPANNLPKGRSIEKLCSFDGDADRIVYYYLNESDSTKINLLDGDKISTLMATHLKELVQHSEIANEIDFCIIQTAYANGSSTNFVENIMVRAKEETKH
jgi:phosphoacetylglucosamine mutase